ncbi:MAG TPA: hypothetical protein VN516_01355, partial [Candidatus Baltobacteraceae bacterium]|nr:hypothetical protein [Candidatus Baltobacteraceae bacterium]
APGYRYFTQTTTRTNAGAMVLRTEMTNNWVVPVTLSDDEPTEVITGYGILKTTEDLVPLLVQRRHAQNTTYVSAVSLDNSPVKLNVTDVKDVTGKVIPRTEALLVKVSSGRTYRALLINPQQKSVVVKSTGGSSWKSSEVFAVPRL